MSNDPFASAPAQDEAQQETTPTTIETSKEKPLTTNTTTVTDQSKLTLTFKGGAGYDAPWVVVHANNPSEANAIVLDEEFKTLLETVQRVGGAFGGMAPNKPAPAAQNNGQPAGANQAPGGETPPPGYVFKSGMGKNGKPWKAFMPIDRNSGLEVQWLR